MRPVDKGAEPLDANGNPKQFSQYQNARRDLIERLGGYCSYCEMKLDASLAVEHVLSKKHHKDSALSWSNFLLGCTNCNSTKGDHDPLINSCFWPDADNTFRAFEYSEDGVVRPNQSLSDAERENAMRTIRLTGLDKTPLQATASDRRWQQRREVWHIAQRARQRLQRNDNEDFRDQVVETAVGHAYWSIWMTVFANDSDMLNRLIRALPGTAQSCFDTDGHPVLRPGGQI
ncbi:MULTISPECIES: HNH endonuclease [unclassified Endozoicomonas]|uniref:HNH endonuclease n=1 Tax=unclassified Endozoicomonas TaxID=2644528 RepID=UPI003BB0631A